MVVCRDINLGFLWAVCSCCGGFHRPFSSLSRWSHHGWLHHNVQHILGCRLGLVYMTCCWQARVQCSAAPALTCTSACVCSKWMMQPTCGIFTGPHHVAPGSTLMIQMLLVRQRDWSLRAACRLKPFHENSLLRKSVGVTELELAAYQCVNTYMAADRCI